MTETQNKKLCETIEHNIDVMNQNPNDEFINSDLPRINQLLYFCIDYNLYSKDLEELVLNRMLNNDYSMNSVILGYNS